MKILTQEGFIRKSIKIHGDKYDYSLVKYSNTRTKVQIICKNCKHIFEQTPNNHMNGNSCPKCLIITTEKYIEMAKKIHNNRYDYKLVEYINTKSKIKIICNKHNKIFEQKAHSHLEGHGCPICRNENFGGDYKFELIKKHDEIKNIFCKNNNIKLIRVRYTEKIEKINEIL